jgi:hypothetical protein
MAVLAFDTLRFTKTLLNVGIPAEHAEAITFAFRDATADAELATKKDIALAVADLKSEISFVKGELNLTKWMLGTLIAFSVANFAKQYF